MGEAPEDYHDAERWTGLQRAFYEADRERREVLARPDEESVARVANRLAELLRLVSDDDHLWRRFRRGVIEIANLDEETRAALEAARSLDWTPHLVKAGYRPPPLAAEFAGEFHRWVVAALDDREGGVDLDATRQRMRAIAAYLDPDDEGGRPGWFRRTIGTLRASGPMYVRTAFVVGVAIAAGAGAGVLAAPLGPVGVAVGGHLAESGAARLLDAVVPKVIPQRDTPFEEAREILRDALRAGDVGWQGSTLTLLASVAAGADPAMPLLIAARDAGVETAAWSLIDWLDRASAAVVVFWEAAERNHIDAREACDALLDRLSRVREALSEDAQCAGNLPFLAQQLVVTAHAVDAIAGHR